MIDHLLDYDEFRELMTYGLDPVTDDIETQDRLVGLSEIPDDEWEAMRREALGE